MENPYCSCKLKHARRLLQVMEGDWGYGAAEEPAGWCARTRVSLQLQ